MASGSRTVVAGDVGPVHADTKAGSGNVGQSTTRVGLV